MRLRLPRDQAVERRLVTEREGEVQRQLRLRRVRAERLGDAVGHGQRHLAGEPDGALQAPFGPLPREPARRGRGRRGRRPCDRRSEDYQRRQDGQHRCAAAGALPLALHRLSLPLVRPVPRRSWIDRRADGNKSGGRDCPLGKLNVARLARACVHRPWPREESNLRTQIRSLPLCPLSYGARPEPSGRPGATRGGERDSNPRPPGPQPGALPTELPPPRSAGRIAGAAASSQPRNTGVRPRRSRRSRDADGMARSV